MRAIAHTAPHSDRRLRGELAVSRLPVWHRKALQACSVALFVALGLASSGCSGERSVVTVRLCGDLQVPLELDALRISILDANREEKRAGIRELLECPSERLRVLPQSVELDALEGELWVVARGLREGVEVIHVERRIRLDAGESGTVQLALNKECVGVRCAVGQTCVAGRCALVPWNNEAPSCASAQPVEPLDQSDLTEDLAQDVDEDASVEVEPTPTVRYCPVEETDEPEQVEEEVD